MFTGIIEETAVVQAIRGTPLAIRLVLKADRCARGLKIGDSLAVNGCCLTVVSITGRAPSRSLHFDLLQETWQRTNLQFVRTGSRVNLERPLAARGRLDGHFVTGHIDGLGRVLRSRLVGKDHVLDIGAPAGLRRYFVFKGSVALDGISLTIAELIPRGFRLWIIPHTWAVTALCERRVGDAVNLEADILGKYVEKLLGRRRR